MRKLIDIENQENLIQCDNKKCDYVIKNIIGDPMADIKQYVNMPCPKCGENLLTEKDYKDSERLMEYIRFVNKWFSWLTIFNFSKKRKNIGVHVHNGINIEK